MVTIATYELGKSKEGCNTVFTHTITQKVNKLKGKFIPLVHHNPQPAIGASALKLGKKRN